MRLAVFGWGFLIVLGGLIARPTQSQQAQNQQGGDKPPVDQKIPGQTIPGQYIVVFSKGTSPAQVAQVGAELSASHGGKVTRTWHHALTGALFQGLSSDNADALLRDPRVRWVEPDRVVSIAEGQTGPPSWGLDRTDQRDLPLDDLYHYDFTGAGVTAYIIDTGIRVTHQDFGGRASWGANFIGGLDSDCHGHGTHVAGTTGGSAHGIAKEVRLVAVKVLDCDGFGTVSSVVDGIEWVTANAEPPAVANMSLGSASSSTLDLALDNSVAAGIFYAVAASNDDSDACAYSPAGAAQAFTVASTTITDQRSSFSNWGSCVDIFAPGSDITSAWNTSDSATKTISGTSMASPHVAGVAALLREEFPAFDPSQIKAELMNRATADVVGDPGPGSPNLLLYPFPEGFRLLVDQAGFGAGTVTSVPAGIDCGTDCTEIFAQVTVVMLSATPGGGSRFSGWSGEGCSGTGTCVVAVDQTRRVEATFEEIFPTLTVTKDGSGTGTVTSASPGIDCGTDCQESYTEGTAVTLTAAPAATSIFAGWSGAGCSGTETCGVVMDTTRFVTATFDVITYELSLSLAGTGSGSVTSVPAGIDCGSECVAEFPADTAVTLTPVAGTGSLFAGWSGAGCSGTGTCTVTMNAARAVTASFEIDPNSCFDPVPWNAGTGWRTIAGPNDGGVSSPWELSASESHSGALSWHVADESQVKDQLLVVDAPVPIPAGSPELRFWHIFDTEDQFDGGVLEYSADAGATWHDILQGDGGGIADNPSRFLANGYTLTLSTCCSNPLPGRQAWSGWSGGWQQVVVDLADFSGHTIELRWRMGTDSGFSGTGWSLDDVELSGVTACPFANGSCTDDMESEPVPWWEPAPGPYDGGGTDPWLVFVVDSHSPPAAWFVSDEPIVKDQVLALTDRFLVPAGSPLLRFWHRFDTEFSFDGGVLEYSHDGGATWFDILRGDGAAIPGDPLRFLANGYNRSLSFCCSNPLPGRAAWSGSSFGWQEVIVDLADFAGYTIRLRWRMGNDSSIGATGWRVDDVEFLDVGSCPLNSAEPMIFLDGFESGDTAAWWRTSP